jgi:hypothetical protein
MCEGAVGLELVPVELPRCESWLRIAAVPLRTLAISSFGPVAIVYDVMDTEGEELAPTLLRLPRMTTYFRSGSAAFDKGSRRKAASGLISMRAT